MSYKNLDQQCSAGYSHHNIWNDCVKEYFENDAIEYLVPVHSSKIALGGFGGCKLDKGAWRRERQERSFNRAG